MIYNTRNYAPNGFCYPFPHILSSLDQINRIKRYGQKGALKLFSGLQTWLEACKGLTKQVAAVGAWQFAILTNFLVMLMLLMWEPHSENHCLDQFILLMKKPGNVFILSNRLFRITVTQQKGKSGIHFFRFLIHSSLVLDTLNEKGECDVYLLFQESVNKLQTGKFVFSPLSLHIFLL